MPDDLSSDQKQQMLQFLTTEHAALQNGRTNATLDINGRNNLFIGALSSVVVALAFIGQVSDLGRAFDVFSLVLLPTVLFMGIVTFRKVLQSSVEDTMLLRGINRIRHFYTEVVPASQRYFTMSIHDDPRGAMEDIGAAPTGWQLLLNASGMIAVINSVLLGVITALALRTGNVAGPAWFIGAGVLMFALSVVVHAVYQARVWRRAQDVAPALFPTEDD